MSPLVTRDDIAAAARRCGIVAGATVLVHASLSRLGHVVGGAEAVVLGLLDAAPGGTLMAPSQTWLNLDPATGVHARPEADWPAIRAALPGYDAGTTPSAGMGRVAEAIRVWPGACRSSHPVRSWTAIGPRALALTRLHDLEDVHGEASPLGAAMTVDACIALIGVAYASCTALHLAETRAAGRAESTEELTSWVRETSGRRRIRYRSPVFDHGDFERIGAAFEAANRIEPVPLGASRMRAPRIRELVPFATRAMET